MNISRDFINQQFKNKYPCPLEKQVKQHEQVKEYQLIKKESSINMNKYLFHYCYKHDNSNNRYHFHLLDLQRLKIRIPSVGKVMGK